MPLHTAHRPLTIDDFLGNEGVKTSLKSVLSRKEDKPKVYLFSGPKGCGKTTLARIVGAMVGCDPTGIIERNCATDNGIEVIRDLTENAQFGPMKGTNKLYILDECHCLTKGKQGAQNALLKITEEPPKHVFFALCTTEPEALLPALASRCMKFEVKNLPIPMLVKVVNKVLENEGIDDFPISVTNAICKAADGCPRQALVLLDSVIDILDEGAALAAISEAVACETASIDLCRLLIEDTKGKWAKMKPLLKGLPEEAESMRYSILGYLAAIMVSDKTDGATTARCSALIDCFTESFMYTKKAGLYNACYLACGVTI